MSLLVKGMFVVFTPTSVWDQQQWLLAHWGHCWKVSSSCFHLQWPPRWSCFQNLSSRYSYEPSLLPVLQESSAGCLSKSPAQRCHSLCLCRHCKDRTRHWTDTAQRGPCRCAWGLDLRQLEYQITDLEINVKTQEFSTLSYVLWPRLEWLCRLSLD